MNLQLSEEEQPTRKRKRAFKRRTLKEYPCCWCGKPTECIHKTTTLKCWDCRMKMIKDYQYQHRAMQANNFNQ